MEPSQLLMALRQYDGALVSKDVAGQGSAGQHPSCGGERLRDDCGGSSSTSTPDAPGNDDNCARLSSRLMDSSDAGD